MNSPGKALGVASEGWDWEKGKRTIIPSVAPKEAYFWQEEPYVSPDGETFAAVVRLEDESFTMRVNDAEWEEPCGQAMLALSSVTRKSAPNVRSS